MAYLDTHGLNTLWTKIKNTFPKSFYQSSEPSNSNNLDLWVDTSSTLDESHTHPQYLTINDVYPIGSVYISTVNSNPSTFLGIGTWDSFGSGRVLVGVGRGTDDSGETKTYENGDIGGNYNKTLSISDLPEHNHTISHTHTMAHTHTYTNTTYKLNTTNRKPGTSSAVAYGTSITATNNTNTSSAASVSTTSAASVSNSGSTGSGNEFGIEQPYIAVYMWVRVS